MRTFQKKSLLLIFLVTLSGISGGLASAQSDRDENKFESSDIIGIDENLDTPVNEYIDTIFRSDSLFINNDFAWDNQLINSGHFDSKNMTDTVRFLIGARSSH